MTRQVFQELQHAGLDRDARARLRTNQRQSLRELHDLLPQEKRDELDTLLAPLDTPDDDTGSDDLPSEPELRLTEAQLLGWLEGLLKGIEAEVQARQAQAEVDQASRIQQAQQQPARPRADTTPGYH